jgi:hypothetical protein
MAVAVGCTKTRAGRDIPTLGCASAVHQAVQRRLDPPGAQLACLVRPRQNQGSLLSESIGRLILLEVEPFLAIDSLRLYPTLDFGSLAIVDLAQGPSRNRRSGPFRR